MSEKSIKWLRNAEKVVEAFGDRSVLMSVTKVKSSQVVSNWLKRGYFPPYTFLAMTAWLTAHGYAARPYLWRQVAPDLPVKEPPQAQVSAPVP